MLEPPQGGWRARFTPCSPTSGAANGYMGAFGSQLAGIGTFQGRRGAPTDDRFELKGTFGIYASGRTAIVIEVGIDA